MNSVHATECLQCGYAGLRVPRLLRKSTAFILSKAWEAKISTGGELGLLEPLLVAQSSPFRESETRPYPTVKAAH